VSQGTAPATANGQAPNTAPSAPVDDEKPEPPLKAEAPRDGNPVLGANFLLPYDRSTYHREWQGGTLRQFNVDPKGTNPLTDNSAIKTSIYGLVTDSLCDRPAAAPEQWQESLAESAVISDDYKTYTFTLRPGVKWQRPPLATRCR
jgi:ABC-type transport system substrate-binding protein